MRDAILQNRRRKECAKLWISAKLRNGDSGDMLHDWRQQHLSRIRAIIFRRYDTLPTSKSRRRWPWNPNGPSKFQITFVYVSKIATKAPAATPQLTAASGDRSNGTLLTSKTSPASARRWPESIEVPELRKFMPTRSSKTSRKTSFCCLLLWWQCTLFFLTITRNGFCSHIRKIISWWPWHPPKNRDIHIEDVFYVDSIYSKNIDIIRKKYWFPTFKQCKTGIRITAPFCR